MIEKNTYWAEESEVNYGSGEQESHLVKFKALTINLVVKLKPS
jgi:hypothetical protein